ncbi:MAG: DUF998 domain-containing protein [Nitrososphaerales archaeon]|jgi:hypothetical membrane protein
MRVGREAGKPRAQPSSGRKLALCGAALYIVAAVQFVVCIAVTASYYGPPAYDPVTDTISDLQAVNCGLFQGAQVCSPLHALANLSVALLGLLVIAGSLMLRPALPGGRRRDVAVGLLVVAGLGAIANAFTPEDVTLSGDAVTALVAFLGANFGLIQMGRTVSAAPRRLGYGRFIQALGAVGVAALTLDGLGLGSSMVGTGTIEWLIVAPILVGAPAIGVRLMLDTRRADRGGAASDP